MPVTSITNEKNSNKAAIGSDKPKGILLSPKTTDNFPTIIFTT